MKSRKEEGLSYKRCKTVRRREPAHERSKARSFSPMYAWLSHTLSVLWFFSLCSLVSLFFFSISRQIRGRSCELEEDRSRRPAQAQHKPALLPSPALGPTAPNPAQTRSSLYPLSSVTCGSLVSCGLHQRALSFSLQYLSICPVLSISLSLIFF